MLRVLSPTFTSEYGVHEGTKLIRRGLARLPSIENRRGSLLPTVVSITSPQPFRGDKAIRRHYLPIEDLSKGSLQICCAGFE